MKEYIRRVKLTVEESWMDPLDEAGTSKMQESSTPTAAPVAASAM